MKTVYIEITWLCLDGFHKVILSDVAEDFNDIRINCILFQSSNYDDCLRFFDDFKNSNKDNLIIKQIGII